MNLEELMKLSDEELNKLAAIKFLWGGIVNEPSDNWNPATDMNDAMELAEKFGTWQITRMGIGHGEKGYRATVEKNKHTVFAETMTRAITIASILAKGE